ncbi:MAG: ATP synthase F1 subunit epsilon [Chlorobiota bacterium]|jgi:F-type H+-transporting ATPase subunit epsilon|nr:ATP synthase F1 subunit epsilon [Chlorobiota bacterium]
MEKALQVDIVTPQGSVYSGVVAAVTVPGTVAPFQVLYNHAPIISSLEPGIVKLLLADLSPRYYVVGGGFVEVLHNHVTVLVDQVEPAERIDLQEAQQQVRQAQQRLASAQTLEEARQARQELHRAELRLRAARLAQGQRESVAGD